MNLFMETRQERSERLAQYGRAATLTVPTHDTCGKADMHGAEQNSAARRSTSSVNGEAYSVQMQEYRDELDFDKKRARRRKILGVLKSLALIVLIPLLLAAVFLVSYALTCIANGATPSQMQELLLSFIERVIAFAAQLGCG